METLKLSGFGAFDELEVNEEWLRNNEDEESGKFVKVYNIKKGIGGNIMYSAFSESTNMKGCLAEYEKAFLVAESDGEYVDIIWFNKS